MIKQIALVFSLMCMIGLFGCSAQTEDLKATFPEYYNLETFKGIEVYVWQTEDGEYRCGAMTGTNRGKTNDEIFNLAENSTTMEEMRLILSSYDIDKEDIIIIPIKIHSADYEIDGTDFTMIKEIFWED